MLSGAVVVAAVGDGGGESIGGGVGADEMVGCCFGCGVGGVGAVGRGFREVAGGAEGAVDLVGRYVVEVDVRQRADDL